MSYSYLALDTSTECCSVALLHQGEVSSHRFLNTREHAKLLLPMVQELLSAADASMASLDGVAFACGPGSFTGLRIAASAAQGLAYAQNLPLVAVSSLAAVAQGAKRELGIKQAAVAMDARMGQVYWACFDTSGSTAQLLGNELVCDPERVALPEGNQWVGVGTGWDEHEQVLGRVSQGVVMRQLGSRRPEAQDVLRLALPDFASGKTLTPEQALPVYLRDKVAKTTAERLAEGGKR
ncbi:MAG: tRNA (adenosine(37)-N6)-threonylcarbamoyltransferase complex dimerization subunit type 1 TsaB [Granulosicoccaceae bacterium]